MTNKKCLFLQNSGLGDCFFLSKAAQYYTDLGYQVMWPLLPQLMYLKDYVITPAKFIEIEESLFVKPDLVVNFQNADKYFSCRIMESKYKLISLDYEDWADYFKFNRNYHKEEELFNKLNLAGKKYTLIGRNYGTPPNFKSRQFEVLTDNEIVNLDFIYGYSIFDWCKVIEEADEIWMIETSYNYIIEKLNLKAKKLKLFSRRPDFKEIDYLFKTNWEYIC